MRRIKRERTKSTMDMCIHQSILTLVIAILPTVCSSLTTSSKVFTIIGEFTTISTTNYPNNYPANSITTWLFRSDISNTRIGIHINNYAIQYHPYCLYDNLTIYDGSNNSASELQRYCGDTSTYATAPSTYLKSTSQDLFVIFHSDETGNHKGFTARVFLIDSNNCEILTLDLNDRVNISSPWYPDDYKQDEKRCWVFNVASGTAGFHVAVDVLDLNLGSGDSVVLKDGTSVGDTNLATITGSTLPGRISSTGGNMYIKFDADTSSNGKGFIAMVNLGDDDNCNNITLSEGDIVSIMSPGYPNTPSRNQQWCWKVQTDVQDARVVLEVIDIDMESSVSCTSESLSTYSGLSDTSPTINRVCDDTGGLSVTSGSDMFIKLVTSSTASNKRGVYAVVYISVSECLTRSNRKAFDGKLSRTKTGKTCQRWDQQMPHSHLFTSPSGFPESSVSEAENFCRNPKDNYGELFCYTTDLNEEWEDCYVPDCTGIPSVSVYQYCNYIYLPSNGDPVQFSSPGYPTAYARSQNLCWVLSTDGSIENVEYRVSLTIDDYDLENSTNCMEDYIKVIKGISTSGTDVQSLCDTGGTGPIMVNWPFVYIQMTSDDDLNLGRGFKATVFAVAASDACSSLIVPSENSVKVIRSAGYRQRPSSGINFPTSQCWKFALYPPLVATHEIVLDFHQTVYFSGVDGAYLRAYNGLNDVSPKILDIDTHTGMQPGSLIAATELYLEYRSDGNDDGFEATVTAQANPGTDKNSCIDINLEDSISTYVLSSPGYPTTIPTSADLHYCWHIKGPRSHSGLALRILGVDFGLANCDMNNLVVDESLHGDKHLVKWCRTNIPSVRYTLNTNDSEIYVRFNTDMSQSFSGISLIIYPVFAITDGCYDVKVELGTRRLITAVPFSAGYPLTNTINCWDISIQSTTANSYEDGLVLEIEDMTIEGQINNCQDTLTVQKVSVAGDVTTLETLCGTLSGSKLINSTSRNMKLTLQDDGDADKPNFTAYVYILPNFRDAERNELVVHNPHGCQVILYDNVGHNGTIKSPGYPIAYVPGLEACWIVAPEDAHNDKYNSFQMQISVTKLDTEYSTDCTKDYVLVRDGANPDAQEIVRFCGIHSPQIITAAQGAFYLDFHADSGVNTHDGFLLNYNVFKGKKYDGCLNVPMLSTDNVYQITSPGYPVEHARSLDLCWIVFVDGNDDNYIPDIDVQDSKLERNSAAGCNDYVAIYEGTKRNPEKKIIQWCGDTKPTKELFSCRGELYIEFHTDATSQERGFDANIKARKKSDVSKCDNLPLIIGAVLGGILALCILAGLITCIAMKLTKKPSKRSSRVCVAPPRPEEPTVIPMMNPMNTFAFHLISDNQQPRQEQPIRAQFTAPPAYGSTNPTYTNGYPSESLPPIGRTNPVELPAYKAASPPPQYDPPSLSPPPPPPLDQSSDQTSFPNIYSRNFATESSFSGGQSLDGSSNDFYANQGQGSRSQLLPPYEPDTGPAQEPTSGYQSSQNHGQNQAQVRDDDLLF